MNTARPAPRTFPPGSPQPDDVNLVRDEDGVGWRPRGPKSFLRSWESDGPIPGSRLPSELRTWHVLNERTLTEDWEDEE